MRFLNSPWTIIIMAASFAIALMSYFFFHDYRPIKQETSYANDLATNLTTEADKMNRCKKNVDTAIHMVQERAAAWQAIVDQHTPPTSTAAGGIDLSEQPYKLLIDTFTFSDNIQKAVNTQVKKGGVKVLDPAPLVPRPTDVDNTSGLLSAYYHYPDFKFPILIFDFGTVRVQGNYKQIMDNVRSYKTMPNYLAVTDGLRIDGTSPNLIGSYQLSVVGFMRGKKVYGSIPEMASTAGNGMGGVGRLGMPGGGRPGFPGGGMPPGMPGMGPGMGPGMAGARGMGGAGQGAYRGGGK